jgi:DNA topoisomerase III
VRVVVAEKPSVARDIAAILGAKTRAEGHLHGGGWAVTWAIGHLVGLAEPHEIEPLWKAWRRERLPMIPPQWPLVVMEETRAQFEVVERLLNDPSTERVICATDAGREGELIFRFIYEAAGCKKPVERLWISSLTPDAIRAGFASLRPGRELDPLADAARGRAEADWLVGMNLTRAYTIVHGGSDDLLSVGRVQTPTLAMLVDREREIRAFVPEDYLEVVATFGPERRTYRGTWFDLGGAERKVEAIRAGMRLPPDGDRAKEIVRRVKAAGEGTIESLEEETKRMAPPFLYDLTELQRHAHRLYGLSAQRTLEIAQSLYETRKLISYPRTDSRHLSTEIAATLHEIVPKIAPRYPGLVASGSGTTSLGKRFVDDSKVTDHHAIIPTSRDPSEVLLTGDEQKIYDLIARRLLQAWHPDHVWSVTTVITKVKSPEADDRFYTTGSAVKQQGWKVLDVVLKKRDPSEPEAQDLPSGLLQGSLRTVEELEIEEKKTRPPKRLTEATLLTAMESAGRTLDDEELASAMRESGLGTPATRASIIETLLSRGFIAREGKSLRATEKGIRLIELVHPEVKSPIMTGRWESRLRSIQRGKEGLAPFISGIEEWVREVVGRVLGETPAAPVIDVARDPAPQRPKDLAELLSKTFGHESFRAHQEEVCRAVVEGDDVLLVMPTGAGKSLCYQLPGLARGGTTLVISPLIALMEDQVAKLTAVGVRAARIHSGRPREESREVCKSYLAGAIEILFVAPERLGVRGFPELLARRKPTLIAVDEAHCISEWGHDFRPDYRLLAERLPELRPAPVIALTATATPRVQEDIAEQLHLERGRRFIHGFRRENIAIEAVEVPKPDRNAIARKLLSVPEARPAIVYAPSRKEADALARELASTFATAAYHAGMNAKARDEVQARFLGDEIEVVVATIAFGMGVDKSNVRTIVHLAMPGTIEGYYQEIGRAGRDGRPSRAVLLHSFADRRLHEFFLEREYPPTSVLEGVHAELRDELEPEEAIRARTRLSEEELARAIEKLWIHGGAKVENGNLIRRGHDEWKKPYAVQRAHRVAQHEEMARFTKSHGCRMLRLVRHFGDQADSKEPCGICDQCAARSAVVQAYRAPTASERSALESMIGVLRRVGSRSAAALHREAVESDGIDRTAFERLLSGLARAQLVRADDEIYDKDGVRIPYQRITLTATGRGSIDLGSLLLPSAPDLRSERSPTRKRRRKTARTAPRLADTPAVEALRTWRIDEARRLGVPAFRILTDRALDGIASKQPRDQAALESIHGVGPSVAKRYGRAILAILSGEKTAVSRPKRSRRRRV